MATPTTIPMPLPPLVLNTRDSYELYQAIRDTSYDHVLRFVRKHCCCDDDGQEAATTATAAVSTTDLNIARYIEDILV